MQPAQTPRPHEAGNALRLALALALALSLALLAWRASDAFGHPAALVGARAAAPDGRAAAAEYLLEPIAGAGHVRVVGDGTPASLLVLIDSASPAADALTADRVGVLLSAGGLYAPLAGETLTLQRLAFSTTEAPHLPLARGLELAALALLGLLIGLALFLSGRTRATRHTANASRQPRPTGAIELPTALRARQADPERIAALMRKWIGEDAA